MTEPESQGGGTILLSMEDDSGDGGVRHSYM